MIEFEIISCVEIVPCDKRRSASSEHKKPKVGDKRVKVSLAALSPSRPP